MSEHYLQALLGGALIGLGAICLMLFNGRIAGISGITASVVTSPIKESGWRWAFLAGLVIAPLLLSPAGFTLPDTIPAGMGQIILAGLVVGFGTRLGSGCTSGHGICGLSRFSLRSFVATGIFMGSAVLTLTLTRHVI